MAIIVHGVGITNDEATKLARQERPRCTECNAKPVKVLALRTGTNGDGSLRVQLVAGCKAHKAKLDSLQLDIIAELQKREVVPVDPDDD